MWGANQWWKGGVAGVRELYRVRKEKETKTKTEKKRKGQVAEQDGGGGESKQECKRQKESREGGRAVLDSPPLGLISFCILCCVPAK